MENEADGEGGGGGGAFGEVSWQQAPYYFSSSHNGGAGGTVSGTAYIEAGTYTAVVGNGGGGWHNHTYNTGCSGTGGTGGATTFLGNSAKGGKGGRGNTAFKTLSNPCPSFSENGELGESKELKVELKMLADCGLVGLPSVGKSTFLSIVTKATPKIAAYHFTTLSPNLGVTKTIDGRSFVIADLPGLIEGASEGAGLGDKFLRHIERTKVIAHIIDMGSAEGRDPYEDYVTINKELANYSEKLSKKPMIVIANKMDLPEAEKNLQEFKKKVKVPVYEMSTARTDGVEEILIKIADEIDKCGDSPLYEESEFLSHVLYKFKEEEPFEIEKDGEEFVVTGDKVEELYRKTKFESEEALLRFTKQLRKLGIDDKLEEMGVQEGDIVRIVDFAFEYKK